jgi:DNA-binding beta-propeller fold protein YncE
MAVVGALVLLAGGCGGGSDNTGAGNSTGTGGQIATGTGGTGAVGTGTGGDSATGGAVGTGGTGATGAPGPFGLQSPVQGSSAQSLTPQLSWDAAEGATTYAVEISTSTAFGTTDVFQQIVDAPATTLSVPTATLAPGVIYYWRVSAQSGTDYTIATGAPQWFSSPYLVPGAHGIGATPDGRRLVVASEVNSGPIALIDLASHTVATIDTGVNSEPIGIAIAPDGQEAVATLLTTGTNGVNGVAVVDLVNNVVEGTIDDPCVGTTLGDIAYFPGGAVAMPDLSPGCAAMGLTTFDPVLNNPQFTFANFSDTNDPFGVAVSPDGTFALVTMELDKQLYRVDFPGQTVSHIALSSSSAGVAITPDGTRAVVAEATLDVVDVGTAAVTPITLTSDTPGGDFRNVAITPDGKVAVVVGTTSVQFVSLTDDSVLAAYPASTGTSVAMSPDGSLVYVTDKGNGWVRVLAVP